MIKSESDYAYNSKDSQDHDECGGCSKKLLISSETQQENTTIKEVIKDTSSLEIVHDGPKN